jgi:molybdopterin molybdotransferase
MILFDEALEAVLKSTPVLAAGNVKLGKLRERVLAEDIVAPAPLPRFSASCVDGYAVCTTDLLSAGPGRSIELTIVGEATAGNPCPRPLVSGHTVLISTGAKMPDGADAVVKQESVELSDHGTAFFAGSVEEGAFVLPVGGDIATGEKVLSAGDVLRAPEIGILASMGVREVSVHRRPRVNILATGDELVDVGDDLVDAHIFSSTSRLLAALTRQEGARPRICGIAPDKKKKLRSLIAEHLDGDLLLVTGGTSKGKHDFLGDALEALGVDLMVRGVRIRPGRPTLFGVKGKTLVFGLPGSPLSTYVGFHALVRPSLGKMMGKMRWAGSRVNALMDEPYRKKDDRRHFVPGVLSFDGTRWHVHPVSGGEAKPMSTLVKSNCLIVLAEDRGDANAGDLVEVEPLSGHIFL